MHVAYTGFFVCLCNLLYVFLSVYSTFVNSSIGNPLLLSSAMEATIGAPMVRTRRRTDLATFPSLPYPPLPYCFWTAGTASKPPLIPSYIENIHPTKPHRSTSYSIVSRSYSYMKDHIAFSAATYYYLCMHSLLHNIGYSGRT